MIDEGTGGGANVMQWAAALAAILVAVGGAFVYEGPLVSSRPPTPAALEKSGADAGEKVPARLWQDPFRAVSDFKDYTDKTTAEQNARQAVAGNALHVAIEGASGQATTQPTRTDSKAAQGLSLDSLVKLGPGFDPSLLVLPVMVPAAPGGELAEQRLRIRVAVVEGLMASGYEPCRDNDHIGSVGARWSSRSVTPKSGVLSELKEALRKDSGDEPLVIPFERWHSAAVRAAGKSWGKGPPFCRVLVLWLPEEQFSDVPLARLALLEEQLSCGSPSGGPCAEAKKFQPALHIAMRVLGPRFSSTLHAMIVESRKADSNVKSALSYSKLYSATPSAESGILLSLKPDDQTAKPTDSSSDPVASQIGNVVSFKRTALTDKSVAESLADELLRRQIKRDDEIAIISEWDSYYGRALGSTVIAAINSCNELTAAKLVNDPGKIPANFHPFHYLQGIDGAVAQADRDDKQAGIDTAPPVESTRGTPKYQSPAEQPEGLNQADYLRRLADQLNKLDESLQRDKRKRLSAVGILGTDLYDKLLILRAVRDRLPNVVFFTTSLDSRYTLPNEWAATHNLIIAAPFGLRLREDFQQGNPPFRDSDQTAVYHGTLCAIWDGHWHDIGSPDDRPLWSKGALGAARIFEIGRGGPVDLSVEDPPQDVKTAQEVANCDRSQTQQSSKSNPGGHPLTVHPPRENVLAWPVRGLSWISVAVAVLLLAIGLIAFAPRSILKLLWGGSSIILLLALCYVATLDGQKGEPALWLGRVNVWPGEAIRLVAVVVCIYFIANSLSAVNRSDEEIENRMFKLVKPKLASPLEWLRHPCQMFSRSFGALYHLFTECDVCTNRCDDKVAPWDVPREKSKIDVQSVWNRYRQLASPSSRWARVLVLGLLLGLLAVTLGWLLPSPPPPTRGDWAYDIHVFLLISIIVAGILLTALVFDGAVLNAGLIANLVQAEAYPYFPNGAFDQPPWPKIAGDRYDLTEVLAVVLIVRRTRVAATAIYYPFVVFLLVLLGRMPVFADWRWSPALTILAGVCLLLTLSAAVILKRSAELARRTSSAKIRLRAVRYSNFSKPDQKAVMDQLADYVENEKRGAFSRVLPTMMFFLITLVGWGVIDYLGRYISP